MSNKNSLEWDSGYHHGYEEGKTKGYAEGYYEGYEKGIQERAISTKGYDDGFTAGFQSGKVVGYNEGKKTTPTETQISDNTFPKHLKTDKDFLNKLQKSKEECLVWIDFEKIHSVMKHLDWKWGLGEDAEVPSLSKLVLSAQKQLDSAIKGFLENTDNDCIAYCGGLKASVQGFADGFCRVTLEFVVSDWDSEIEGIEGEEK